MLILLLLRICCRLCCFYFAAVIPIFVACKLISPLLFHFASRLSFCCFVRWSRLSPFRLLFLLCWSRLLLLQFPALFLPLCYSFACAVCISRSAFGFPLVVSCGLAFADFSMPFAWLLLFGFLSCMLFIPLFSMLSVWCLARGCNYFSKNAFVPIFFVLVVVYRNLK